MTVPRLAPIALAALALWWQASAAAADSGRHQLQYDIVLAGFEVGDIAVTAELGEGRYRLEADTRNTGLLRLLAGFTSHARSRGRVEAGRVRPRSHSADNVWVGERRSVRSSYADDGGVAAEVVPDAATDGRDEVPEDRLAATLDPLSAALQASIRAAGDGACTGTIAVFDGRRRYDLRFEHLGSDEISGPVYQGPAIRCRIHLIRIAGFSSDPWWPRSQTPDWADIWFAMVAERVPALPVELRADIGLGTVVVDLTGLDLAEASGF